MTAAGEVTITHEGQIATLTIDRPDRANALDSHTARAIARGVEMAAQEARGVIVTGAGRAFCAGGDLDELERWSGLPAEQVGAALYDSFQAMIRTIRASDAIVVAAVNGAAVGAGLDLALACDFRVAAAGAKLGQVWVGLGVIPGTGGAYLTQALVGPGRAAELLLTGDLITAERAKEIGLVTEVFPAGTLLSGARRLLERVLRHPPQGVVANKRAMVAATEEALDAALRHAAEVQPKRFTSEEFKQALRERRTT